MTTIFTPLEEWRPITGWEYYEVSSFGRVRSLDRWLIGLFNSRFLHRGRVLRQVPDTDGYMQVALCNSRPKTFKVHHLVLEAFSPEPRGDRECRHRNAQRNDNRFSNLVWGTKMENEADKVIHASRVCGERVGSAKLLDADVLRIREASLLGAKRRDLASIYGISHTTVCNILTKTWAHLPYRIGA